MKRRQKEKISKRETNKILKEISKYFTISKIRYNIYFHFGGCLFYLKENTNIVCIISNLNIKKQKDNHPYPLTFSVLLKTSGKYSSCYAEEYNQCKENVSEFIYIISTVLNDFVNRMKDPTDTEEEFWEELKEWEEREENIAIPGMNYDEYAKNKKKLKDFLNCVDYNKIPEFFVRLNTKNCHIFRSIATIYYYPLEERFCPDSYIEFVEDQLSESNTLSLKWRTFNIKRLSKRERKQWIVYTKDFKKGISLFKYLKIV